MKKIKITIWNNIGLLTILWALIILVLCATPGSYLPTASWLEMLSFDKWVHAGLFFILTSLVFLLCFKKQWDFTYWIVLFILTLSYGGLLEIMQALVFSERSADWQDFVANSFGSFGALVLFKKTKVYFH
ncbi:MAG: VanZ family protein [Sphingobacteriaceae bacterium]|nr:VanZ family protein [Sphingobacteriaceae bacterium]